MNDNISPKHVTLDHENFTFSQQPRLLGLADTKPRLSDYNFKHQKIPKNSCCGISEMEGEERRGK